VNFLSFAPDDKNSLYAATGNGLYLSLDRGKNWERIFKGKNYLENECTALAILPSGLYLGTMAGLFTSKDRGRSWHKESGILSKDQVLNIACNLSEPDYIYVAGLNGVFRSADAGKNWEKVFGKDINGKAEIEEENGQAEDHFHINYIAIDGRNLNHIYLATSRGVYQSWDRAGIWDALSDYGLLDREARFLLVSYESVLYAVSGAGIFRYQQQRWFELSSGLAAQNINSLYLDRQANLYAAGQQGLFRANIAFSRDDCGNNATVLYCQDEPEISAVQNAAIKYAEVGPEKILRWRKECRMKAALPRLSIGIDRSKSTNYEIYTSATAKYAYEGPCDRTYGWDITLSWELGDLIWSDNQTSIDARSKQMVELRDDILDEVTRLYFERLRLKMELGNLSIEDRNRRLEKELKIKELTAMLDALTGGYFSQQLKTKTGS